jgi:signal transduction histidine kinase/DNA-binding response OmpR family regulator/HPt (histidine-containing phosphotransfer) domain-containing protein
MTTVDPLAEVRAEFAAGLSRRIATMRATLGRLEGGFGTEDAEALYRAAHSLTGTAGSFGAEGLAHVAGDLENLARGWLARGAALPEEWRAAAAAIAELDAAAREYRATAPSGSLQSPASRLAVVGELASLINAAVDMREIFQGAIDKIARVLDFRRASVVLIDESATHYYLHTLFDKARGGFLPGEAVFPIEQGITGEAIRTGRPIRVDALSGTEGILLQEGRRVSAMIVPLHVGDRVIGALNFGHEEPGHYTEEDLDWAVVLGRQIETSLYYSKLLSTIAQQREALAGQHAAVQRQRNQLEALIDASDAAIMLVGPDRKIAYANAEMAQLLGLPPDAVLGASVDRAHRFLRGAFVDPTALRAQARALSLDVTLRDQVELSFPQRGVWQRVVAPVRESDGALLGHIVLYRDVTREVEADRLKSEFVATVSHELRTPMTSVKTSLSLLLAGAAGALTPAARELLEIALRNADRLIRLVNDVLDLSRLQAGRMEFPLGPVPLADAVAAGAEMVAAFAAAHSVTITIQAPPEPQVVLAEPDRVLQAVVNLLSNAIKFSPKGGRVAVRWWPQDGFAVTEVADQGPGIPANQLSVVFDPFTQLDSSTTREHGGAGLGLTITRRIVEALGGSVWAESEVGKGSRFFVRLPLASPEQLAQPPQPTGAPAVPSEARVLLAHGDADWRRLATVRLGTEGWRVVPVATGAEALAFLRGEAVDLIVTALELPDMQGLDLVQRLRGDPATFDTPALIVAEADATAAALEAGAEGWVQADPQALIGPTRRLLAARERPVVLLVEDDPLVRDSLARMLRRAGCACLALSDAVAALEFVRRRRPSVVITDFQVAGMNGLAFLEQMHRQASLRDVPTIMLSAHVGEAVAEGARRLGAQVVTKPFDSKALVNQIREMSRKSQRS